MRQQLQVRDGGCEDDGVEGGPQDELDGATQPEADPGHDQANRCKRGKDQSWKRKCALASHAGGMISLSGQGMPAAICAGTCR